MSEYNNSMVDELASFCVEVAEAKFAENICKIKVTGRSSIADYFIVCTVNSEPQLRAVHSAVEREVRERYHLRNLSLSNLTNGGWVLVDFGDVLVHVMTPEMRDRYCLESLWGDDVADDAVKQIDSFADRSE